LRRSPSTPGAGRSIEEAAAPLKVLTFEVGGYLLALPAEDVARIDPSGAVPSEGVSVVDAVGLLKAAKEPRGKSCTIVLAPRRSTGERFAVTAARAGVVRMIDAARLLPIPAYLFRGKNPFQGMAPPAAEGERALFVLASPDRLLSAAEAS